MGTSGRDDNGWPPEGGGPPEDLPELPDEWGAVVIPDDPAALSAEAAAVRRELRAQRRRAQWRRRLRLPAPAGPEQRTGGLRFPLLVMAVAVLVTLASVFAATWSGTLRPTAAPRSSPGSQLPGAGAVNLDLPALELLDPSGGTVALRRVLPVIVVLTDGCACTELLAATAAARPDLTVVAVTAGRAAPGYSPAAATPPPVLGPGGEPVPRLTDPTGELRNSLRLGPPDGTASVLLVTRTGRIMRLAARVASVEDFRADLSLL